MHRLPVAWLSLQADDAEPQRFWAHLRVAMHKAFLPEDLEPFMRHPDNPSNLAEHLAILVNQLDARFGQDFVLILDDYHRLVSSSSANPFDVAIAYLLAFARLTSTWSSPAGTSQPAAITFAGRGDLLERAGACASPSEKGALVRNPRTGLPDELIERLLIAWELGCGDGWACGPALQPGSRAGLGSPRGRSSPIGVHG
jgi:hypothetical protein